MFRKKSDHLQPDLFELEASDSEAIRSMIETTQEYGFYRVFLEHFHLDAEDVATLIPVEELGSICLQSPDDEDADFRKIRGVLLMPFLRDDDCMAC
ncbi:MAG: hypothetical protein J7K89_08265 [Candidatus Cloacimonetes bacterium]|nr:hypothetical protein [Candidatus Cloacimonadota bacterium]